jgi:hypothetical protein
MFLKRAAATAMNVSLRLLFGRWRMLYRVTASVKIDARTV